jgi:putative transposase
MVRFTWNKLLEKAKDSYFNPEETFNIVNYGDIVHEYPFMDKSNKDFVFDRHAVSNEKTFLKRAFKSFFAKFKKKMEFTNKGKPKHFPHFKSKKHSKNSYTNYNAWKDSKIDICSHMIKIPCLGWVKYSLREKPIPNNWKIRNVTISKSYSNKYYCSICFEYEDDRIGISCNSQDFKMSNPNRNIYVLGLDYSSSSLYIDSNGNSAEYPRYFRNNQKRLRIIQQRLSRQQKGGKNYDKTLARLQSLHEHISNCRKDFLHKLSTSITKMYDVISVEDINMQQIGMKKGKFKLGKSTYDNAFGMFRDMLEYKQRRIPYHLLMRINKWYPSSKTCSRCGYIKLDLELKDRTYHCPQCGFTIDRDINAALNLKNNALKTLNENLSKRYQFVMI